VLGARRFDAVLHFAAHIWVSESVREPAKYYRNNVANALSLFELSAQSGVRQLVFSSTAAVYGEPEALLIDETTPQDTAPRPVELNPDSAAARAREDSVRRATPTPTAGDSLPAPPERP